MKSKALFLPLCALILLFAGCAAQGQSAGGSGNTGVTQAVTTTNTGDQGDALDEVLSLQKEDPANITKIRFSTAEEGGLRQGETEDADTIRSIHDLFHALSVTKETNMAVDDAGLDLWFTMDGEDLRVSFETNILVLSDGKRYEVEPFSPLQSYILSLLDEEE